LSDVKAYMQANRRAWNCWRESRHMILHRVATIQLAASEADRKRSRRALVLVSLRKVVWKAAHKVEHGNDSIWDRYAAAQKAYVNRLFHWVFEETTADYWRTYLLGSVELMFHLEDGQ
jgi:hypothetical protein